MKNSSRSSSSSSSRRAHFQRSGGRELTQQQQQQRQKQLLLTKGSEGYARYAAAVPPQERSKNHRHTWHPQTPNPAEPLSVAQWRDVLGAWRRLIHKWTNVNLESKNLESKTRDLMRSKR
ncbi:hypothetical protein Efla_007903 [Eimeria flavescens]